MLRAIQKAAYLIMVYRAHGQWRSHVITHIFITLYWAVITYVAPCPCSCRCSVLGNWPCRWRTTWPHQFNQSERFPFSSFSFQPKVTLAKIKPDDKTHANFAVLTSCRCHSNGECAVVVGSDNERGSPASEWMCCETGIRGLTPCDLSSTRWCWG